MESEELVEERVAQMNLMGGEDRPVVPGSGNIGRKVSLGVWREKRANWDREYEAAAYDRDFYERSAHYYDRAIPVFADYLRSFAPTSVVDMGCGPGTFVAPLVGEVPVLGIDVGVGAGYDLPPENYRDADLTRPLVDQIGVFEADLVLCLEVFEHIPPQHEGDLLDNLLVAEPRFLLLSVAVPRQWGRHHYNCREVDYVRGLVCERGYEVDEDLAAPLREMKYLATFYRRNTTVFRKGESDGLEP